MTSKERARLIVFSRAWCHLCDDLLAALGPICEELGADIEVVDVDSHPEFEKAYGERVPVVNPLGTAVKTAETMITLQRALGTPIPSRVHAARLGQEDLARINRGFHIED